MHFAISVSPNIFFKFNMKLNSRIYAAEHLGFGDVSDLKFLATLAQKDK